MDDQSIMYAVLLAVCVDVMLTSYDVTVSHVTGLQPDSNYAADDVAPAALPFPFGKIAPLDLALCERWSAA